MLWSYTKYVQIMPMSLKMARPVGHMINIGLHTVRHKHIFVSETISTRDLIFGV